MTIVEKIALPLLTLIFSGCLQRVPDEVDEICQETPNKFCFYKKNDKSAFFGWKKIAGADARTFEAIGWHFARDKNKGYYCSTPIEGSHGKTFKEIDSSDYSTDGYHVFFREKPLNITNTKRFRVISGRVNVTDSWATDGEFCYYNEYKIYSLDLKSLEILKYGIYKDKNWVYLKEYKLNYAYGGKKLFDTLDAATFKVIDWCRAKDKFGCIRLYTGRMACNPTFSKTPAGLE